MRLERVSHDVVDDTSRRDELTVESAREDVSCDALRPFSEGVYFQAAIFVVLDLHGVMDKQRSDASRGLKVFTVADLPSFSEMTAESVSSCTSCL